MPKLAPPLTDRQIKARRPSSNVQKVSDGHGLTLLIHPNGAKYFQLRYRIAGVERVFQIGRYPNVSLSDARAIGAAALAKAKQGIDPVQARKNEAQKAADNLKNTFEAVAREWMAVKVKNIRPSTISKIENGLNKNVFGYIGHIPINELTNRHILETLKVMETRGALEVMGKCRQWIRAIFDFAIGRGLIVGNPMPQKELELAKHQSERMAHFKSLDDARAFLMRLNDYGGMIETTICIRLLMLNPVRPGELRQARWSEFDFEAAQWEIPLARMKNHRSMGAAFVMPLARQSIELLKQLKELTGHREHLFPKTSAPSEPMSDATMNKVFRLLWTEYHVVSHGVRHFFSTQANEAGAARPDVIEAQLGHKGANAIRAIYNLAKYMKERRELAQWWADRLS